MTKNIIAVLSLGLSLGLAAAAHADTPQQNRMVECNKQATGKKGDERKTFMSACLSGKPAEVADKAKAVAVTQQQRMKDCNASAVGKKGDERKAFMSACLKK